MKPYFLIAGLALVLGYFSLLGIFALAFQMIGQPTFNIGDIMDQVNFTATWLAFSGLYGFYFWWLYENLRR